ncbi:lytic transglycosylase domain-containing protein [Citrobacter werkmanii]|uniref:lytic transglycosylase domain-containing protein n=1 Tax=Citrobacter werkmanii TaxID=67827 RepID=UPI00300C30D1
MAENLPVLDVTINSDNLKRMEDVISKFQEALKVGPGGFPVPIPSAPPTTPRPFQNTLPQGAPKSGGFLDEVEKFVKGMGKDAELANKTFTQVNKTLKGTTSLLQGLFSSVITWGARLTALAGGGVLGFDILAKHASNQYRESQGLAMTTGQMQASESVYGTRLSGTSNIIQSLTEAQQNPESPGWKALASLGLDPKAGVAKNLPLLLSKVSALAKQYKGTGMTQSVLSSYGLTDMGFDVNTVNQLRGMDVAKANQQFGARSQQLDMAMGTGVQQSFQNTVSTLQQNMDVLGNTFLSVVAKLNGPITEISTNLTKSIQEFLTGPNGQALFDDIKSGLSEFSAWLKSSNFKEDLTDFEKAIEAIGSTIWSVVKLISGESDGGPLPGAGVGSEGADPALVAFANKYNQGVLPGANPLTNKYNGIFTEEAAFKDYQMPAPLKGNIQNFVEKVNEVAKLPQGFMSALASQESSWNPLAKGKPFNDKGEFAAGLFQFTPGTAGQYGLSSEDRFDPNKETVAAGRYLSDLQKRYHGDVAKMLVSYNGGKFDEQGNLSLRMETVKELMSILPKTKGALEQHPGIMGRLAEAKSQLSKSPEGSRATIQLDVKQAPGSDVSVQAKSLYTPANVGFVTPY